MRARAQGRIAEFASGLSEDAVSGIAANTAALKQLQETPDDADALKCVPTLQLSDLDPKITTVPTDKSTKDGTTLLTHDLFTNNILYAEVLLDMGNLPPALLPLVPLFCRRCGCGHRERL